MTESELRAQMVNTVRGWIGKNEADGTHTSIIDLYNCITPLPVGYKVQYTDSWCATTPSAAAYVCQLTDIVFPECSCQRMIDLYKRANRWVEDDAYVPIPGDLIFYGWSDSGVGDYVGPPDHVGLIEECDGTYITVLEGNLHDAVGRRRIAVNSRYIRGYGVPDYASKATIQLFPDVQETAWYAEAVNWAKANGIVVGRDDGLFHPNDNVTRAECVAMLYRARKGS